MPQDIPSPVTKIESLSHTQYESDLLRLVSQLAESASGNRPECRTSAAPGQKGELLTTIVIGLATNAAYDLLKQAAKRLINHPGRPQIIQLGLNGSPTNIDLD